MRYNFLVILTVVVASSLIAGGVVASPNNSSTETGATVPDPSGPTEYAGNVGNTVHIVSAEVKGGKWVVVLEADAIARVTVTDTAATMGRLENAGTGNFDPNSASRSVTVSRNGRTKVTLEAATYDGAEAITVIANGDGWYRSTGANNDPFEYFSGMSGLLTGMGLAVVMSGGGAWYHLRKRQKPVRRAD